MSIHSLIVHNQKLSESFSAQADKDIQVLFGFEPIDPQIIEPFTLFYHLPDDSEFGELCFSSFEEMEEEESELKREGFITFHFEPMR